MIEILQLLLKLFVEWPQRQANSAKKSYAQWRNGYDKAKEDRARRAALIESAIVREKDKLP